MTSRGPFQPKTFDDSPCPITCYLGKETDTHLATTSFQAVVESNKVSPLSFSPDSTAPVPSAAPPKTCSLDSSPSSLPCFGHTPAPQCQYSRCSLTSAKYRGMSSSLSPAAHTVPDTSQDAVGLLGHLGILLAHVQPAVNQHPQVLFCHAAF